MPNFPSALREPRPDEKGQTTEQTILDTLPDVGTTVHTMAILRLLSSVSSDHVSLFTIYTYHNISGTVLEKLICIASLADNYIGTMRLCTTTTLAPVQLSHSVCGLLCNDSVFLLYMQNTNLYLQSCVNSYGIGIRTPSYPCSLV